MSGDQTKLLSKGARKFVLWIHVMSSALWLGAALAMMIVIFARDMTLRSGPELYGFCLCAKLIDDFVIVGSCGLAALSGMLLAWKTPWGFFRWWWVAVKLCVTLVLLCTGAGLLGPWINETEALARAHGAAMLGLARYQQVDRAVGVLGATQLAVLAAIMYLSIFKPWGKRQA